jgi:predicted GNAT family N-acyltransferase
MSQRKGEEREPIVTIKLASSSDELLQCYSLRAAVFMGEQHCPYFEEFDGNDYTATHIIMYVDGEPAGSMRIRWFQSFAKLERCVFLRRFRSQGLFQNFVRWAMRFAASKGYAKAYLHLQKRLLPIMEREGFRRVDDRVFNFSDHEYYAVVADLQTAEQQLLSIESDPMVLNRPEDRMDMPGVLEESVARGASAPHAPWQPRTN